MGKSASSEDHELAGRFLVARELCLDLATNRASRIAEKGKQCEVRQRYEAIAKSFYCRRIKRRSLFEKVMLNKAVEQFLESRHEEERLYEDLLAVYHDPHYSVDHRRAALQDIDQLRKQSEQLAEQQHAQVVELSLGTGCHPSKSERLLHRFKTDGRDKFFQRLESAIRRYLKAKIEGAHWAGSTPATGLAASMSSLQLLALEWLRDKEELWRFLEACLIRWEEVTEPDGVHRQNVRMHNICETKVALDDKGINVLAPNQNMLPQLASLWREVGIFVEPNCLRQRSSRNIRNAKAELKNNSTVTYLGNTQP